MLTMASPFSASSDLIEVVDGKQSTCLGVLADGVRGDAQTASWSRGLRWNSSRVLSTRLLLRYRSVRAWRCWVGGALGGSGRDWGGVITSSLKGPHAYLHRGEGAY